jgi:hypothetical protein
VLVVLVVEGIWRMLVNNEGGRHGSKKKEGRRGGGCPNKEGGGCGRVNRVVEGKARRAAGCRCKKPGVEDPVSTQCL